MGVQEVLLVGVGLVEPSKDGELIARLPFPLDDLCLFPHLLAFECRFLVDIDELTQSHRILRNMFLNHVNYKPKFLPIIKNINKKTILNF